MVSRAIKLLRIYNGVPQHVVAKKMGIAQSGICRMESGLMKIRPEDVVKLAKIYGVDPELVLMLADKLKKSKGLEKAIFEAVIEVVREY